MKIILYKDVPNLGEEGDVKVVADGYARNFLLPQKFAVRYTKATEMELAQKQKSIARRKEEKSKAASDTKTRIEALTMEVAVAAGEKGRLFGSVTSAAVVDYLASQGVEVERKKVELPEGGIKMVGDHSVKIKLYGGEEAVLKVTVSASGEKPEVVEAPKQPKAAVKPEAAAETADDAEDDAEDDSEADEYAGESAETDRFEDNIEEEAETEIED